jgi:photosystem II stability/assembly factor-like uncharacterized protein
MKRGLPGCFVVLLAIGLVVPAALTLPVTLAKKKEAGIDGKLLEKLEYRSIGPYRGGRSTAVAGIAGERDTFYMGTTGGGVWKTDDGGANWRPVADKTLTAASIGALAVAPSDSNVVYAGTGSACPRGNVSPGDGIYRSTDAGRNWSKIGLPEAGQIGRIVVHPNDPDHVYVAALGHIFGPNEERGVYRTKDGGKTWEKVLGVSDRAGAVDLAMDPNNPRVLFAAMWEVERKPWTLISGGDGSGVWRSTNGGDDWEEVTKGLPEETMGKISVSVSGGKSGRVYALIEAAETGGLYRSDDGGDSFTLINSDHNFLQRAWYYTHVTADPADGETVYINNVQFWRSHDGGKSFKPIRTPHGDNHDMWINPDDPNVMVQANDGGANVSYNGGRSWSTQGNQPTAEFYRVSVDNQFPYRVYGCQQDNSCVTIASRTGGGSIGRQDWWVIGGGESGHVAIDPDNPDISYAGSYGGYITRYDHATGQNRNITAWPQVAIGMPSRDLKYRFQWNAPIRLSPHDKDTLYHASQHVHRTRDGGQSWDTISPDLSHDDDATQGYAGEPITRDNTGVEVFGTVFAFEESPHQPGLLWAGTDDGRVHLSRDAGKTWDEITPAKMPERGQVNTLALSTHDAGRAFIAVTRYKFDDFAPYIFRTDDYGASWDLLTDGENGIDPGHFTRVVREDPDRKGLLYAGTEFGVYYSIDDGANWQPFRKNMPVTPVTDLQVHEKDLVVATQGRGFWILDDLTPLHQLTAEIDGSEYHLFAPREVTLFSGGGTRGGRGANGPRGTVVRYVVPEGHDEKTEIKIQMLDSTGNVLRTMSSTEKERRAPNPFAEFFGGEEGAGKLAAEQGMNQWVWNLRLPDADIADKAIMWGSPAGPRIPPGDYEVRMTVGKWNARQAFSVRSDPRLSVTQADLEAQFALASDVHDAVSETHRAVMRLRDVREQAGAVAARHEKAGDGEELTELAKAMGEKLTEIEEKLHQYRSTSSQDVLNYRPGVDGQLLGLKGTVESAQAGPTDASAARFRELRGELDGYLAELQAILDTDLAAFNAKVAEAGKPAVFPSKGLADRATRD